MTLEFRDPAPRLRPWEDVVAELHAHPGEWAVVATKPTYSAAHGLAYRLRVGGYISCIRGGELDAEVRPTDDGGFEVFAKSLREPEDGAA